MRSRRLRAAIPALILLGLASGCTYYPSAVDIGGVRLQPERARAVRSTSEAVVYFRLRSTGKYGDVLTGAEAPIARRTELRDANGRPVAQIEIPGETTVSFDDKGPRIVLGDLTRELTPGEVIIVTLRFEKSGSLGLVTAVE
jgi:copper(I)-binding protein